MDTFDLFDQFIFGKAFIYQLNGKAIFRKIVKGSWVHVFQQ